MTTTKSAGIGAKLRWFWLTPDRLLVPVPALSEKDQWTSWGMSLGYSLLAGIQRFFMLGSGELDFELEGPWQTGDAATRYSMLSLVLRAAAAGATFAARGGQFTGCAMEREMQLGAGGAGRG